MKSSIARIKTILEPHLFLGTDLALLKRILLKMFFSLPSPEELVSLLANLQKSELFQEDNSANGDLAQNSLISLNPKDRVQGIHLGSPSGYQYMSRHFLPLSMKASYL